MEENTIQETTAAKVPEEKLNKIFERINNGDFKLKHYSITESSLKDNGLRLEMCLEVEVP